MKLTRQLIFRIALGIIAVALVAGIAVVNLGHSVASAQTTTPTTTPTAQQADKNQLKQDFINNFASQLGVDTAKLNAAYSAAVNATADQAVKDGKLTQAQADKIKAAAQNGFKGGLFSGKGKGKAAPKGKAAFGFGEKAVLDAAAKALTITTDELKTQLKAGKSIADVAADKKVDLQTVKDAILAAVKAELDAKVKENKLTQDQADKRYQAVSTNIDKVVNAKFTGHQGKAGKHSKPAK